MPRAPRPTAENRNSETSPNNPHPALAQSTRNETRSSAGAGVRGAGRVRAGGAIRRVAVRRVAVRRVEVSRGFRAFLFSVFYAIYATVGAGLVVGAIHAVGAIVGAIVGDRSHDWIGIRF